MMSSRFAVVVVTLLAALPALAQNAGDACDSEVDGDICSALNQSLLACDGNTNTYVAFACQDLSAGSTCGDMPCAGSGCSSFDIFRCIGVRGADCVGISPLFEQGGQGAMSVPCAAGNACTMNVSAQTETCTALPSGVTTCRAGDQPARCQGDLIVVCLGFDPSGSAVVATPGVRDCGAEGLTCAANDEDVGCVPRGDQRCGSTGNGSCVNNVAHRCDGDGAVTGSTDCSTTGRACVVQDGTPQCISADSECGPRGLGVCTGNVATICEGGAFDNEVNCSSLGRTCGPVDASGQIGCVVRGGEGEGEGEG